MGRVTASIEINNGKSEEAIRFTQIALEDIVAQLNGKITLTENIACKIVDATFTAANVQLAVDHGLGRVPVGYLVASLSTASTVYNGDSGSSSTQINLKASAPVTAKLVIF